MTSEKDTITAEFYVVLKPTRGWSATARSYNAIIGVKATDLRQSKPAIPRGSLAVRVKLNFDRRTVDEQIPVVEADVITFMPSPPDLEVVGS